MVGKQRDRAGLASPEQPDRARPVAGVAGPLASETPTLANKWRTCQLSRTTCSRPTENATQFVGRQLLVQLMGFVDI